MSTGSNLLSEESAKPTTTPKTLPASTIGSKFIVALTGAGLTIYVLFHMLGNMQVLLGREVLNRYAEFLQGNVELLWVARIGLLVIFLLHIYFTIRLRLKNRKARSINYVKYHHQAADLASRTMILTGLVILAFVIYHLLHFTLGATHPVDFQHHEIRNPTTLQWETVSGSVAEGTIHRHDVYKMVVLGFRRPLVSITYIIAQVFLGLHLWHGVPSLFQSLGIMRPRWRKWITGAGIAVALIVVIGNIFIPVAIMTDYFAGVGYFDID